MKIILPLAGAMCALLFCSIPVQAAPDSAGASALQLTIELRDGSRVVGKSREDTLSLHSVALGDMKLPWAGIRSIDFADANSAGARLTAANGDVFAITLAADALRVETGFGQTELPLKLIRSVKVAPANVNAAGADSTRLTIELRDGSRVAGQGLDDTLIFHAPAMGDLKLNWACIRSITFAGDDTTLARLTATNGDVYEVQFDAPAVRVETSFGKTELPVKLIRGIKVSAPGNGGQWPSGLVGRWSGDGNAKDSAGHFDGEVSGGVSYVPGPTGQAFQFNGGPAKVDFGNDAGNFGRNDFTILYWMKTDSRNSHEAFLTKRGSCDAASGFWDIIIGSGVPSDAPTGVLDLHLTPAGSQDVYWLNSSRAMNDGRWHHIAWVRQSTSSGSSSGLVYVDGALDNSRTYPEAFDIGNHAPLVLGHNVCECCDGTRPYSGAAAELQIFSHALTAEEILTLYEAGKPEK
jgi:hypothetical protein